MSASVGLVWLVIVAVIYLTSEIKCSHTHKHIVKTLVGEIEGFKADDGDYVMYLGVPYAKVNKSNPFGVSLPYPKFEKTFIANDDSAVCPQVEEFNETVVGTLDCLQMNIYVPQGTTGNKLPVLVWIHGGSLTFGFSRRWVANPKYLVRHGVILVTVNYRMGPYGFMCLDTPEIPGNQGLKDQLFAIRWIKRNIDAFGGNKNKITLMGESSGALSVDLHLMFAEDDLFHNAILQSGAALSPWALLPAADKDALNKLGRLFENKTKTYPDTIKYLAEIDPLTLIDKSRQFTFGACVEKEIDGTETYVRKYPINLKVPKVKDVSIMIGFNSHEMVAMEVFLQGQLYNLSMAQLKESFNMPVNRFNDMLSIINHFYFTNGDNIEGQKWNVVNLTTDITFGYPAQRTIKNYLANGAKSIFLYMFSYSGGRNYVKSRFNITEGGASHADELGYLFDMTILPEPSAKDKLILDRMTTMWTNFAKHSDPVPNLSPLLPIKWQAVEYEDELYYMDINEELSIGNRAYNKAMSFWELFYSANSHYEKGWKPK